MLNLDSDFNKKIIILIAMVAAVLLSFLLTPDLTASSNKIIPELSRLIPTQFGDWRVLNNNQIQVDFIPRKDGKPSINNPYDDTLMRTYVNSSGQHVNLAIAYGKTQRQEVKIHRPELCYYAQGFKVNTINNTSLSFSVTDPDVQARNMLAENINGFEAVTYWIRIGSIYSQSPWKTRLYILKEGLLGNVSDGILVRASTRVADKAKVANHYAMNKAFLSELMKNLHSKQARDLLVL